MDSSYLWVIVAIVLLFALSWIRILAEYERGVVFRLGRLIDVKGPGLIFLIPFVDRMQKVDLRTVTMDIPVQEVMSKDNITVKVNAVCYFRVLDPNKAIVAVQNYFLATSQIAQTSMRSVVGQVHLDDLLSDREQLNQRLQKIIDLQTEPWGIKVSAVEVKAVDLPRARPDVGDHLEPVVAGSQEPVVIERGVRPAIVGEVDQRPAHVPRADRFLQPIEPQEPLTGASRSRAEGAMR